MLVKDRMTLNPITALPETTHKQAVELMREHNIHHLPIVDKRGRLVGIVVEEDLYAAQPSPATTLSIYEIHSLLSKLELKEIMQRPVYTVTGECSLEEAAGLMLKDLKLAIAAAHDAGAKVEMGEHAKAIYEAFAEQNAGLDFSGVIRTLQDR